MSDALDVLFAVASVAVCSLLVRVVVINGKLPKWWWGIAIVPLFSLGMALAVLLFPRPIPSGWQEGDFDTGRADFIAFLFFGAVVPVAYLAIALPVAFVVRLWKNRRVKA